MSEYQNSAVDTLELAAELTIAWLGNQNTRTSADDVPAFLRSMHEAVTSLASTSTSATDSADAGLTPEYTPAVGARKSLASKDHILSMIDGKPYRTLRRHLKTNGLTPDEYRQRYNLKADYPMVAESYSEARRAMAKSIGLGRKAKASEAAPAAAPAAETTKPAPARRSRKTEAAASNAE